MSRLAPIVAGMLPLLLWGATGSVVIPRVIEDVTSEAPLVVPERLAQFALTMGSGAELWWPPRTTTATVATATTWCRDIDGFAFTAPVSSSTFVERTGTQK